MRGGPIALAALLGCASGAGPGAAGLAPAEAAPIPEPPRGASSLDEVLARDMAPYDALPWSGARRLAWADFRGTPPAGGPEGARTGYSVFYAWKCAGQAFEFRVVAALLPARSWVKGVVLRDSAESRRTMRHEQAHFDLAEAYARSMRRAFGALADPCRRPEAALDELARAVLDELRAAQRRYDEETGHGLNGPEQARWEREVAARLASLGLHQR